MSYPSTPYFKVYLVLYALAFSLQPSSIYLVKKFGENEGSRPRCGVRTTAALRQSGITMFNRHDLTKHDRFYSRNSFIEFLTLDEVSTPRLMTQRAAVERTNDLGWFASLSLPSLVLALRG